jgi:structural maintenance of chromosomes protein 6
MNRTTIGYTQVHIQAGMEGEQTRVTQNTRTLSGGERSYTTVALLIAMWVNMEMPFNILDEFDVFMV